MDYRAKGKGAKNMLKNNKEREEYIRDENNWEDVEYRCTRSAGTPIEVEDNDFPKIRLKRLKGTGVHRIQVLTKPYYDGQGDHWVTIGTKVFNEDGKLTNIYDLSDNQLVTYLREH